ncbi:MAG: ATP-binding protein [Actinomycetales bacterium]
MTDRPGRIGRLLDDDRRTTFGVRGRIVATVVILTAIGMGLAGGAFMIYERRQLVDQVDVVLRGDAEQFTTHGTAALTDPNGPTTFPDLLKYQLNEHVASNGQVLLALEDDTPVYVTAGPFDLLAAPEVLDQVATLPPDAPTQIRQVDSTAAGPIRYVMMRVHVEGYPQTGTLISAVSLQPALQRLASSARFYTELSLVALALVGLGAWVVAGRLLRPLRLLREAAETISHTDLTSRIPVSGNDDVTELTRTVNAMFDRLESAFETQQQFLDDAGHELRTPITIVGGHLEVLDPDDAGEVRATRALVLDELDRMAGLVNDLIVLAQAGRPDFVSFDEVDVDQLLRDVLDKAQALAERTWELDSTVHAVVLADGHRLTQAMLQLADNAVRHTTTTDTIGIGGIREGTDCRLWVRDTGPGVAPDDAHRIFERFGRAGGSRGDGGSGLGLSIVAGIAAAHGGRVDLDPSFGGAGARFSLVLPLGVARWEAPSGRRGLGADTCDAEPGSPPEATRRTPSAPVEVHNHSPQVRQ